ncbi:MAG: DUF1365 domain-containing protein [Pseudomonadota bacterium]
MIRGGQIFCGTVVHKRLRPRQHKLSYSVFSMLVNVDDIQDISKQARLFSYNRPNLFSIYDKDFGRRDGSSIAEHARKTLQEAGICPLNLSISLLAYPRLMGYAFNPLSVYYCADDNGSLHAMIYEVTNTFGERRCYVIRVDQSQNDVYAHSCAKEMYVSPFAPLEGHYSFRITRPSQNLLVGVNYRDSKGPLIKTFFRANAQPFQDRVLVRLSFGYPLMTLKVIVGIHYEALRLWLKRINVAKHHATARFAVSSSASVRTGSKG